MAVSSAQVTVTTSATKLSVVGNDYQAGSSIVVANAGAQAVFLGPSNVTTATGYSLAAGASLARVDLGDGDVLYGIVAATTAVVHVLRIGV